MIIDVHAHYTPRMLIERFDSEASKFPGVKLIRGEKGVQIAITGADTTRPIMPRLSDLADRRAWMDRNGIDHQLVGGWLDSFGYELDAEQGLSWSRFINACMRESLREERRFTPLATVPMQDGRKAAEVLGEALEQGFGGVMIGTLPKGQGGNLDDPSLDPFWEAASRLQAAVFIHPMFVCGEPRLADYDLVNAIGRLVDTSIAVSRLLYSGHLLRFGGVKVVLAHGGAALPLALGRLARSFEANPGKYADPRKGFSGVYLDSCVLDTEALQFIVARAGVERVMLGSDAPFPIGDPAPLKVIDNAPLDEAARKKILGETARRVFRIRADCGHPG